MSNVIRFLESMGNDSSFARLSPAEYAATVALLDVGDSQQRALLDRNHVALNDLLGGRHKVLFAVFAPDDDEKKDDERRENDEPERETPAEFE